MIGATRRRGLVSLVAALLWMAGSVLASETPAVLMPDYDPDTIDTPQRAEQALAVAEQIRLSLEPVWARREYECYQRWLVNRCRARLAADRRVAQSRLKLIEIRARQVIREDDAFQRNEAAAQVLAQRADDAEQERQQRDQAARDARDHAAQAAARKAQRVEDDKARAGQARDNAHRQAGREADLARRRAEAQARIDAGPANAERERARRVGDKHADPASSPAGASATPANAPKPAVSSGAGALPAPR